MWLGSDSRDRDVGIDIKQSIETLKAIKPSLGKPTGNIRRTPEGFVREAPNPNLPTEHELADGIRARIDTIRMHVQDSYQYRLDAQAQRGAPLLSW